MEKTRLIYMGTPEFARVILERLHGSPDHEIVAVYAQPDKPAGRGNKLATPPVAVYAKENGLKLFQPPRIRDPGVLQPIQSAQADFIIVAAYGKILPDAVLKAARKDCINVHASLLPKHRGAAPINSALLCGDAQTGVAIMRVAPELDSGPVYLEKRLTIQDSDNAITLTEKLSHLGADALLEALRLIVTENLQPKEQDHSQATHVPKMTKDIGVIDWNRGAREIFNQVRALVPWPVAETKLQDKRLKIYDSRPLNETSRGQPGEIVHLGKEGWTVAAKDRNILITEVQLEGKKRMSAFDVANGLRLQPGAALK